MICKMFEIRAIGTLIPVIAVKMVGETEDEKWLCDRCGFGEERPLYYVAKLSEPKGNWDPYDWGDRTMHIAHRTIAADFDSLQSGDIIDVEYILGQKTTPKTKEGRS